MANEDEVVGRELVESLSEKMDAFAASLDEKERDLFTAALQTHQEAIDADDVSGFGFESQSAGLLSQQLGKEIPRGISTKMFPKAPFNGPVRMKTTDPIEFK